MTNKQIIQNNIRIMSGTKPLFTDSGLRFDTSESRDMSVAYVSVSEGAVYIIKPGGSEMDRHYKIEFLGVGVSKSLGTSVSFDFSTKDMFSEGIIYSNSLRSPTLEANDLSGPCLIYQGQVNAGPMTSGVAGKSRTIIFFSIGLGLVKAWTAFCLAVPLGPATASLALAVSPAITLSSCRGLADYNGDFLGVPGFGVSAALGWVTVTNNYLADTGKFLEKLGK